MIRKGIGIMMSLLLTASILVSCKSAEKEIVTTPEKNQSKINIGITFDTFVLDRWTRDRDVFVSTAEKLGAKVNVQNANGDVEKQKKQIRKFVEDGMDTIVIVAVDCYALVEEITEARNYGIEIISYDRLIQGVKTDLYVTVDNNAVGAQMAQEIKKKLPQGGNIVMICGPEMDTNSLDVAAGFEKELGDELWKVVVKTHVKSWTPEYGSKAVNEAFQKVGNTQDIDAVMCGNDGLAGYAIRALSEQQLAGSVIVVGQDADLEACQRIVEGTQTMTVYKPIKDLAKIAAERAVNLANSEGLTGITDKVMNDVGEIPYYGLEPIGVTAENMEDIIIKPGFHPRDDIYLNVGE